MKPFFLSFGSPFYTLTGWVHHYDYMAIGDTWFSGNKYMYLIYLDKHKP